MPITLLNGIYFGLVFGFVGLHKNFFFPLDRDSHRHVVMIVVAWALIKIMGVRMCLPQNVIPRNIRTYIIHFI